MMASVSDDSIEGDRCFDSSRPNSTSISIPSTVSLASTTRSSPRFGPLKPNTTSSVHPGLRSPDLLDEISPYSLPELDPADLTLLTERNPRSHSSESASTNRTCPLDSTSSCATAAHSPKSSVIYAGFQSSPNTGNPHSYIPPFDVSPLLSQAFNPLWRIQAVLMSTESAQFVEKFKYVLVASQLLSEGRSNSLSPHFSLAQPPFALPLSGNQGNFISIGLIVVLFAAARWVTRANKLLFSLLLSLSGVIVYAILQRRRLRQVRASVLTNAEKLVNGLAKWDSVGSETLGVICDTDAAKTASHIDDLNPSLPQWRSDLDFEQRRLLCVILQGCQSLSRKVDPMELDKLLDVYNVMDCDVREAMLSMEQERFKSVDDDTRSVPDIQSRRGSGAGSLSILSRRVVSVRDLRLGWRRVVTARRLLLCTLIVVPAIGIPSEEISRWDTVDSVLAGVRQAVWDGATKLGKLHHSTPAPISLQIGRLPDTSLPWGLQTQNIMQGVQNSPSQGTPQHSNSHSIASSIGNNQGSLYPFSILPHLVEISQRLRSATALASLLREDAQRLNTGSVSFTSSPSADAALVAQFDLLGADLRDLVTVHTTATTQLRGRADQDNRRRQSAAHQHGQHHRNSSLSPVNQAHAMATMNSLAEQVQRNFKRRSLGPFGLEVKTSESPSIGDFGSSPASPRGMTIPMSGIGSGMSPFQKKRLSSLGGSLPLGRDQIYVPNLISPEIPILETVDPAHRPASATLIPFLSESTDRTGDADGNAERQVEGETGYLVSFQEADGTTRHQLVSNVLDRRILPSNPSGTMVADLEALLCGQRDGDSNGDIQSQIGPSATKIPLPIAPAKDVHPLPTLTTSRPSRPGKSRTSRQKRSGESPTSENTIEEDDDSVGHSSDRRRGHNILIPPPTLTLLLSSPPLQKLSSTRENGRDGRIDRLQKSGEMMEIDRISSGLLMDEMLMELGEKVTREIGTTTATTNSGGGEIYS